MLNGNFPVSLVFPFKARPKERPRFGRGKTYTAKDTTLFEKAIGIVAMKSFSGPPSNEALHVVINFVFKRPKSTKRKYMTVRPDLDNLVKSVTDALNNILYTDDSQIVKLTIEKKYGIEEHISLVAYELDSDSES